MHGAVGEDELRPGGVRRTPVLAGRQVRPAGVAQQAVALARGAVGASEEERLVPEPRAGRVVIDVHGLLADEQGVRSPVGEGGQVHQAGRAVGHGQVVGGVVGLAPDPAAAAVDGLVVVYGRQRHRRPAAGADVELERDGPGAGVVDVFLLDIGEDGEGPGAGLVGAETFGVADAPVVGVGGAVVVGVDVSGRAVGGVDELLAVPAGVAGEDAEGVMVHLEGEADLLEVVGAGHAAGGLAHLLHGGTAGRSARRRCRSPLAVRSEVDPFV